MRIAVTDAERHLADLVRRAEAGEEVILTRAGRPAAKLVRVEAAAGDPSRRVLLDAVREAGSAKASAGPSAARSQDFLYGEGGVPE